VRQRPIRRVTLTVPPAPGSRPKLSSGNPNTASGREITRPQNAAISNPLACLPDSGGQRVEYQRRAVAGAGQMCAGGVTEPAELGEIAAAAKRRPVAGQHDLVDRGVELRDGQRLQQRGAGIGGKRVVALRPVERNPQRVAVAVCLHRIGDVGHAGRAALGQPPGEFRTALQGGVGQRFGHHTGQRRPGRIHRPQHVVTDRCGHRPAVHPFGQFGDRRVDRRDGDHPAVVSVVFSEGECCLLQPEFGCLRDRPNGHHRDAKCHSIDIGDRLRHVDDA
jgi:hypothetical protein